MFEVIVTAGDDVLIIAIGKTVDDAIRAFIKKSVKETNGNPDKLCTKNVFLINDNKKKENEDWCKGQMIWAVSQETNEPILMVKTMDRNILRLYNTKGMLIGRNQDI